MSHEIREKLIEKREEVIREFEQRIFERRKFTLKKGPVIIMSLII